MPDYSLPARVTLSFGRSGTGKSTFCYRYLANAAAVQDTNPEPTACIFIFDWKLEAERRLGIPAVTSQAGLEKSLAQRWVVFNPHLMFPGTARVTNPEGQDVLNDEKMACRWFCKWVFEVAKRGGGRKIIYIDELKNFASKFSLPPEISRIARMGRSENLELLTSTQFPRDYHVDLRDSVTEWVCFNITEPGNLDAVRPYYSGVDKIPALPAGSFISFNRDSGVELAGRLF